MSQIDAVGAPHDDGRRGLTSQEAERILGEAGPNELTRESTKPAWWLLLAQFNSPVIWLLLAVCLVSAALGEIIDAVAIGTIVVINAFVGSMGPLPP